MNGHLHAAEMLAQMLDNQFQLGKFRFGLDPIIGIIPVLGPMFTSILSVYIIWIGVQMKVPSDKVAQMIGNVVFDFLLDFIPVLGQIADFAWKSNAMNIDIIKKYAPADIIDGQVVS